MVPANGGPELGTLLKRGGVPIGARHKLNVAFVNGALIVAALAGLVFRSWTVFIVVGVVLVGAAFYCGDIRRGPREP
jgi:hypothetical protein